MSATARIRPAASTVHCVGHSGVSTGIGSNHGGRAGDTGREGERPSHISAHLAKIEVALAILKVAGIRPATLRAARSLLDRALGLANCAGDTTARASILRMRNWLTSSLRRMERRHA